MTRTTFAAYRTEYPNLPAELLFFFDMKTAARVEGRLQAHTVMEFLEHYAKRHGGTRVQPGPVIEICSRLCSHGWMSLVDVGGFMGLENRYLTIIRDGNDPLSDTLAGRMFDCAVYGLPAVYDHYAGSVWPLINWNANGDPQIGTCFVIEKWIAVTALHCILPASRLAIRTVPAEAFQRSLFYSHPNEGLDLALMRFDAPVFSASPAIPLPSSDPEVLLEVMALGYPNVPGFMPALAAEAAQVSGRLTVARGRVASKPAEIFSRTEMLLITARVRGGFSGGPVLDAYGQVAGMISREPMAEAIAGVGVKYDELGYGAAVPASAITELLDGIDSGEIKPLDMSGVNFETFEE